MPILFEADADAAAALARTLDDECVLVHDSDALKTAIDSRPGEAVLVFGMTADAHLACAVAEAMRVSMPSLGVVLVRRRVDSGLLATAMRAGIREVVKHDDETALRDACSRARAVGLQVIAQRPAVAAHSEDPKGRVVTVFSAKGGCGKTTLATNLATAWAAAKHDSVCLIDLDLSFGDVAITLQLMPEHTLGDAVSMSGHMDELGIRAIVTRHSSGLDTLLAPLEPGDAERVTPAMVTDLVQTLTRMYDVIIIDTPPSFTEQVLAAMDLTDRFLLLTTPDIPALKNLKLALQMLQMLGYEEAKQQIVLNRSDAKVGLTDVDVERALKRRIAAAVPSSRDVPAAVNRGVPLALEQPNHPVSVAIKALATPDRVATPAPAAAPGPVRKSRHARKMSLLRRGEAPA